MGSNFVPRELEKGDDLIQARLVKAAQEEIQTGLFRNVLKKIGRAGLIAAELTAGIAALEYFCNESGFMQNLVERITSHYNGLVAINPATGTSRLAEIYKPWLASAILAPYSAGSLGWWGLNSLASTIYSKKNAIAEAVLDVPHFSYQSEVDSYRKKKKWRKNWDIALADYFVFKSEMAKLAEVTLLALDGNLRLTTALPKKASKYSHINPSLEDVVTEINTRHNFLKMDVPRDYTRATFPVKPLPNQEQRYCEAWVFENKDRPAKESFLGYELFSKRLSSTQWVVGSLSPQPPKRPVTNTNQIISSLDLREAIKYNIFRPTYYPLPWEGEPRVAYIPEVTFPGTKGGVSAVVNQIIRNLRPEHLGVKKYRNIIIPIIGFPGPPKTGILYDITEETQVSGPLVIYGHTKNPSLDTWKHICGPLFSECEDSETQKQYRSRELKNLIYHLEESFSSLDIPLFYNVADRMQYFSIDEILNSTETLEVLHDLYLKIKDKDKPSFEYFQNEWRVLRRAPVVVIKSEKVEADVYYSLLTGVAGVYAALARRQFKDKGRYKKKIALQEHGIFAEDIRVYLANANMHPYLKHMWEHALDFYSKIIYEEADEITTLCKGNVQKERRDGAKKDIKIIPVGINHDFPPVKKDLDEPLSFISALAGNVQPVKRPEVYIAAAELLEERYGKYVGWTWKILGRDDEDSPDFVRDIHTAVDQSPYFKDNFFFAPYLDHFSIPFAGIDAANLTSASEVMPMALIELMACGKIPIAFDIGAVDELLNGGGYDGLGAAGLVLPVGTLEDDVESVANANLVLYLRKYYRLTGREHPNIPFPEDKYDKNWIFKHDFESVGITRSRDRYNIKNLIPIYGQFLSPEVKVA